MLIYTGLGDEGLLREASTRARVGSPSRRPPLKDRVARPRARGVRRQLRGPPAQSYILGRECTDEVAALSPREREVMARWQRG